MSSNRQSYLQHHFANKEQQYQSAKLGMWAFLVTEVLTFAGLFCAYTILRNNFPETFKACSALLNTVVPYLALKVPHCVTDQSLNSCDFQQLLTCTGRSPAYVAPCRAQLLGRRPQVRFCCELPC